LIPAIISKVRINSSENKFEFAHPMSTPEAEKTLAAFAGKGFSLQGLAVIRLTGNLLSADPNEYSCPVLQDRQFRLLKD
jgi:hypothetical protein